MKLVNIEIKVGDFVRTKNGKIRKVKRIVAQYYITDKLNVSDNNQFTSDEIVKHSKNLIDLVEVGDYVNGFLVSEIAEHGVLVCKAYGFHGGFSVPFAQYDEDIRDIVTREQFEQMKYIVEE